MLQIAMEFTLKMWQKKVKVKSDLFQYYMNMKIPSLANIFSVNQIKLSIPNQ